MTHTSDIIPCNSDINNVSLIAAGNKSLNNRAVTRLSAVNQPAAFNTVPLESVIDEIRSSSLAVITTGLNDLYQQDEVAYKALKPSLPATSFNGTFKNAVNDANIDEFSGLMIVDVDKTDVVETRAVFESLPSCVVCFTSPSGAGVKAVINIGVCTTGDEYRAKFEQLRIYYHEKGLTLDPSGKDPSRKCFLCHDPDVYANYGAEEFDFSTITLPPKPAIDEVNAVRSAPHPARVQSALACIFDYSYDVWSKVAAALGHDFDDATGFELFHQWSQQDPHYKSEQDCRKTFDSFKHKAATPVTCGTC